MTLWEPSDPRVPGWYAVTICWDPEEGFFPSEALWGREGWEGPDASVIVLRSPDPFKSRDDAHAWAHLHDIEAALCIKRTKPRIAP